MTIDIVGGLAVRFKKSFWLMLFLTLLSIFFNLGNNPLLDPDEPVYAETPKEMYLYNDFISPRIYGEFWYDKPPMYYWLVAGAFKVFGQNEFAARFPSAMLAVIGIIIVYTSATKLFNERVGLMSGLVLATSVEYFYLGKAAVTDIALTLFLTASLLCFLQKQYYLFYLFSALATLTKGPIGILFPGAIILIWMVLTRGFDELKQMKLPIGVVLWIIVAMPWYWVMYHIHGADFLNGFIGVNNITRFTTAEHAKTSGWYFFIPVLILGFFPWISLLFQAIKASIKTKGTNNYSTLLFLNVWAAFIFVFFSISNTKLITYILPVYPPLAILVGWYLNRISLDYQLAGKGLVWPVVLTLLLILLVGGMVVGVNIMPPLTLGVIALSIVLLLMTFFVWHFLYKRDVLKAVWTQALTMTLASALLVTLFLPPIAENFSTRNIAQSFLEIYDDHSPVYVTKFLHPGFAFYTNIYGKEINSDLEVRQVISKQEQAYLVIQQSEYQRLSNSEKNSLDVLAYSDSKILLFKR